MTVAACIDSSIAEYQIERIGLEEEIVKGWRKQDRHGTKLAYLIVGDDHQKG